MRQGETSNPSILYVHLTLVPALPGASPRTCFSYVHTFCVLLLGCKVADANMARRNSESFWHPIGMLTHGVAPTEDTRINVGRTCEVPSPFSPGAAPNVH